VTYVNSLLRHHNPDIPSLFKEHFPDRASEWIQNIFFRKIVVLSKQDEARMMKKREIKFLKKLLSILLNFKELSYTHVLCTHLSKINHASKYISIQRIVALTGVLQFLSLWSGHNNDPNLKQPSLLRFL